MTTQAPPQFRVIPIALIDAPALPSRTTMDDQKLDELTAAIVRDGFQSTIGVVATGDRFEVVYGHRRRVAAGRAGVTAVPCFVYPTKGALTMRLQYTENWLREDIKVTDEAILFAELLEEDPAAGTDGVAVRTGQTRAYVEGRLLLLRGCDHVFQALAENEISIGVAQQLNRCTEERHRRMLLETAIKSGATVGLVTQWIAEWKSFSALNPETPAAAAPVTTGGPVMANDYFTCRVCGERDNTARMQPVNVHDYCWQQISDSATGLLRSRTDYVLFPRTRDDALGLLQRIVDRFPELAG